MEFGYVLLIISAVLGAITGILSVLYAYVYFTQIRVVHKHKYEDAIARSLNPSIQDEPETQRLFHPFMILAYASRIKRQEMESVI